MLHPSLPTTPSVRLNLRGAPQAVVAGTLHSLQTTDAFLLAWLALEGATPREQLAALLWPSSSTGQRRTALRQRLFRLRKQLGLDLVGGAAAMALADGVEHDLDPVTGPNLGSPLGPPLADSAPGLLGALPAPAGCVELEQWLAARRSAVQALRRQDVLAYIETLEAQGDAAGALPLAIGLLETNPLSEDAHRRVMRLHYLCGDRAAAMLAFDRCEAMLKHDVGTGPAAATLALLHSIEAGAEPLAPAAARGWNGPLPASVLRPPRLIGRDAELRALHSGWQVGRVLSVTGEAGIGKSRLLLALAGSLDNLAMASARPGDGLVPYASLARLLRVVLALAPQALAALDPPARQQLNAALPGLAPEAAPASGAGAGAAVAPAIGRRQAGLSSAVLALLQAARASFEGLVLDDLHFADDASLDLLQVLLSLSGTRAARPTDRASQLSVEPLRWCLGHRPPAPGSKLHSVMGDLARALPLVVVPVQALSVAQLAELVDSLALPGVDGASLAPALRQRSGGNPLFALETLKLAWSHGQFDWRGDLPRPQSLAQLISQQLARLSPPALALARLAAVAGIDFSLPLAEKVLGQNALALADPWHELESQQVMQGTDFAHDLVFEAVLGAVPAIIARHLHGHVAEFLERASGEPARVAAHWEAAGQRARALPGLRAAAERAHRAMRERERIEFLLRAADIAEGTGEQAQAFDCVAQAVETHMNAIRQADGFPLLDRLDRLAKSPAEHVQALAHRAWYCSQLPDHRLAVQLGEQALALAETLGERGLIGPIQQRLATSLSMLERFDEALLHLRAVQSWADDALAPDARAEFQGNFAVVLDNLGRPEEARIHHRLALADSQAQAEHAQTTTHLANHAVNRLNAGDVAGAMQLVQQALQLATRFELEGASVAFLWLLRSQGARALGHYRDALAAAEQAAARLQTSNPARLPLVWLHRAHLWLELGQTARAGQDLLAVAEAALGSARLPGHVQAQHLLLQARWQRALGQDPEVMLGQALATAPLHGWPETRMTIQVEQAGALPDPRAAMAALQALRHEAEALGLRGTVLSSWLSTARAAAAAADGRAAGLAAEQLMTLAESVLPTWRPRAHIWLGAALGLAAAGQRSAAAAQALAGQQWLLSTAAQQVDETFAESFLQRGPGNSELLRLAVTLAAPAL